MREKHEELLTRFITAREFFQTCADGALKAGNFHEARKAMVEVCKSGNSIISLQSAIADMAIPLPASSQKPS